MGILNSNKPKELTCNLIDKNRDKEYANIPDDQYLCPTCENIPQILSIHTDNGHIELNCKYHGIIDIDIEKYFKKMEKHISNYYNIKCFNCPAKQNKKEKMFFYCYYCKVDFCEDCIKDFHKTAKIDHQQNHLDVCIPINEKKNRCLEHYKSDIKSYCEDCQENVCEKDSTKIHKGHKRTNLSDFKKDIDNYKKIIINKNKILAHIIKFNQIIINTYEKFSNNYYHIQSLINIGKSIEEENNRDSKKIECMDKWIGKKR